jgi:hypothetical protein
MRRYSRGTGQRRLSVAASTPFGQLAVVLRGRSAGTCLHAEPAARPGGRPSASPLVHSPARSSRPRGLRRPMPDSARCLASPGFGDEEGCAAWPRARAVLRSGGLHEGEIASCEPVRLQARGGKRPSRLGRRDRCFAHRSSLLVLVSRPPPREGLALPARSRAFSGPASLGGGEVPSAATGRSPVRACLWATAMVPPGRGLVCR